jgi:hypothetical protein
MIRTPRVHRYERKAWRRQWYLGPGARLACLAPLAGLVAWDRGDNRLLTGCLLLVCVIATWRAWREWRRERHDRARIWRLTLRFDDGTLYLHDGAGIRELSDLHAVVAVDAIGSRRRIERILVDARDGSRTLFAGLRDMDAFLVNCAPRPRPRVTVAWQWDSR